MNRRRAIKFLLITTGALFALAVVSLPVFAQCAMCRTSIAGSPDAARLAERFNFAVFVLLIPPVMLFCGFIVALYKFRKAPGEDSDEGNLVTRLLRWFVEKFRLRFKDRSRKGAKATARLQERSLH
ncbi:MAG: hypothetical protein DMF68_16190 [Acidobacteria bacterium]|nr:MAG: hypothetical protein DMF68_16190 [Acidobacteriota bacterium]